MAPAAPKGGPRTSRLTWSPADATCARQARASGSPALEPTSTIRVSHIARTMHLRIGFGFSCCAALGAASGCVVPVAPDFRDEPNYAPFIAASSPLEGEEVNAPGAVAPNFEVAIGDPNVHDRLYFRWLFDYPKYDSEISKIADGTHELAPTGEVLRDSPPPFSPNCLLHGIARGLTRHRLALVVSDRAFDDDSFPPDAPFDAVGPDAQRVYAVWFLNMECR